MAVVPRRGIAVDAVALGGEPSRSLGVMVIDARRLIADALASLIARSTPFSVLATAGPEDAVAAVRRHRPAVTLFGIGAAPAACMPLLRELRAACPDTEIIIVIDALQPEVVRFVLEEEIGGLILSDVPADEISACIAQISRGHAVLPAGWQGALASTDPDPVNALSKRQLEVLQLLADGCSYEEIATRLVISVNTVKFHTRSIFSRLGVRNRMAAARLLGRHG